MKKIFLLLFFSFTFLLLNGQNTFYKSINGVFYGGLYGFGVPGVRTFEQTNDYGYIMGGSILVNTFNYYVWIKADSAGNFLWANCDSKGRNCYGHSIVQTADSGFIMCGSCYEAVSGDSYILVDRIDKNGNKTWSKIFADSTGILANSKIQYATSIIQTKDGKFIFTGAASKFRTFYPVHNDILIAMLDTNGAMLWSKSYAGSDDDNGYSIQQTSDSGFIVSGIKKDNVTGNYGSVLLKTDSAGNLQWTKVYNDWSDWWTAAQQTMDGGYILTGCQGQNGSSYNASSLIKTNSLGDTLWTKKFGGMDTVEILSVRQTADSGYILSGSTIKNSISNSVLIKTNALGEQQWSRVVHSKQWFSNVGTTDFYCSQTRDSGYILCGTSDSGACLIKLNSFGMGLCNNSSIEISESPNSFAVLPVSPVVSNAALSQATYLGGDYGSVDTVQYTYCSSDFHCEASFTLYPDTTIPLHYFVTNTSYGTPPIHYVWRWGDGMTDTIPNPSHMYAAPGFKTICLTMTDSTGCSSSYCDRNYYLPGQASINVSTNEIYSENYLEIFPNPTKSNFTITTNKQMQNARVEIINSQGSLVYSERFSGNTTMLNNRLSDGIYFVRVTFQGFTLFLFVGIGVGKLIKKNGNQIK